MQARRRANWWAADAAERRAARDGNGPPEQHLPAFLATLQAHAEVRAVLSVGSRARGATGEGSDWDYIVICHPAPPAAPLRWRQLLAHTGEHAVNVFDDISWQFGTTDDFVLGTHEVCVSYYAQTDIDTKVDAIAAGRCRKEGFYYPTGFLAALADAAVIYDPERLGASLCERVRVYPERLRETILHDEGWLTPYYLDRLRSAIARHDHYYAFELLGLVVNALVQQLFAAHRTYFRAPKRIDEQLAALPLGLDRRCLADTLAHVLTQPNDHATLECKRARLVELSHLVDSEVRRA
jgi:predicted nucleotidyltransferase